ncbi:MAG: sulfonate transport system substrate-binding protein, partial [Caballeronia sp.]|nr:sulfonate transport system substrate-binding protein [Caballeronia sp.]
MPLSLFSRRGPGGSRSSLRSFTAAFVSISVALSSLATATPARAEGTLRIAEQFGVVYLLLNVARDQKLIEQEGKKAGVDIKVDWLKLSGGAAINDALLSNSIDIAAAGVGPLMTIWDRTHGKQNVKGVASLGNLPYFLVSNNPNVKTIADFTEKDRIAVPAVSVSVQSRVLQFAAAKHWGDKDYDRLDKLTQAVPHPDAAAAIIAGGTEITGHFGNPPFQEQELAGNPKAHIVLNSYDVLGGPGSSTVLYATEKFHDNNPKTYHAFIAALADAARFVAANPEAAA